MKIYGIHIQRVAGMAEADLMKRMPQRWIRSRKYLRREDKLRCLGAGVLMHRILGIAEDELRYGRYGKPYVPGREGFSISHGGNWAVLAVDEDSVGVDIEPMDEKNLDVARRVFTADEICWMQQDPIVRFHILWTIKESIMKAEGLGMNLDPASFDVLPIGGPNAAAGGLWHTAWMLHDGCAIACACRQETGKLEFEEIF